MSLTHSGFRSIFIGMKHAVSILPVLLTLWLLVVNRASGTSLTITITNLPSAGRTAEGQTVAFVGTLNGWDNASTVATVTQHRLTYTFSSIASLTALGSDWADKPDGANAGFQFVAPGSWDRAIKADFNSNDGNFRVALNDGAVNTIEIDAGAVPTLIDQASAVRVNGTVETPVVAIDRTRFAFPGGRWKALVMSYDDGHVQDRGVVPIFNAHGIKGTFHLNSNPLDDDTFVTSAEVGTLYAGHEVSSHTVDHPYLDQLGSDSIRWEIGTDCSTLGSLAGYAIRSMSYPFGAFNRNIMSIASEVGVRAARTTMDTYNLAFLPPNPLKWHPTCHHTGAEGMANELVARTNEEMALLFIWGHSYELDYNLSNNSWSYLSSLCSTLGDRGDVWYATMTEVGDYLAAIRALSYPTSNCVYNPSSSITVWAKLAGRLCRIQPGKRMTYPAGAVAASPDCPDEGTTVTIRYGAGSNALGRAAAVSIHVGHDGWQDTRDVGMTKDGDASWTCSLAISGGVRALQFAFTDGLGVWDDNGGSDWSLAVRAASTGTPAAVQCAPGTPAVPERPADGQNQPGDAFSLSMSGGPVASSNRGGFGSLGSVYVNYDANHLYLGATGCDVAGSNNAMIIFLSIDTMHDGVPNLWTLRGTPFGLGSLHNVGFAPAANLAIVLGDEYGDGTFPHFNLANGYDFGQGVYYLSSNSTSFLPVPGARLAQFDGTGTVQTATSDDDGNRLMERWVVSIPWSSLNAALGAGSVNALYVSGLIASDGVSGSDRYLSSNTLGESATGSLDSYGNYGFNFVTLCGHRIGLPGVDSDRDGMSDLHETLAGTDAGNANSFLKMAPPAVANDACVLRFDSVPGKQYRIQYKQDLTSDAPWTDFGSVVTATGTACTVTDLVHTESNVYYRVRLHTP